MARPSKIRRRKRFFVGCEGESEQGYAALLQKFANDEGVAVHIDARVISKAGDPLALAERAAALIEQGERGSKPPFVGRFLIFDTDVIGNNPDRDAKLERVARDTGLILVRQNICIESFLLRHFDGHENDRPATSDEALARLQGIWPEYRKGASAQDLERRIRLPDAKRAARNQLNSDFVTLFNALGLGVD